jgi:transposase, IS30 family
MRRFQQLDECDRFRIARCLKKGLTLTEMSKVTGFHKSTISRELSRNQTEKGQYRPKGAQKKRDHRNQTASRGRKNTIRSTTRRWIANRLRDKWSPEEISGRSKIDGPQSVSHQYVYNFICRDKERGGYLHLNLRRTGRHRYRTKKMGKNEKIKNRADISTRPKIVEKRIRLGDLEGDTIIGRHQRSHIVTLVDRKSRFMGLEKVEEKTPNKVNAGLRKLIRRNGYAKTLTVDNGLEFSAHKNLSRRTGVKIYFAKAYAAWQRGSIENMNRLVRQYLPKKTDFRKIKTEELVAIENALNNRPRKCLNYHTPKECHRSKNN